MDRELTDYIVINYKKNDKDNYVHFLTEINPNAKTFYEVISPKASIIYSSKYNVWYLRTILKVRSTTLQGVDYGISHSVEHNGKKFSFCFFESKSSTGAVSIIFRGDFGIYLYTGSFCYYNDITASICPQMKKFIDEETLTRLYFDSTYYEQKSDFFSYDELVDKVGKLLISDPSKITYFIVNMVGIETLIADIVSSIKNKCPNVLVHLSYKKQKFMSSLGYEHLFTQNEKNCRIFIRTPYFLKNVCLKKRNGCEIMIIGLERQPELHREFQNYVKIGEKRHCFTFYSHSSHEKCSALINLFKPASIIPITSEPVDTSLITFTNILDNCKKLQQHSSNETNFQKIQPSFKKFQRLESCYGNNISAEKSINNSTSKINERKNNYKSGHIMKKEYFLDKNSENPKLETINKKKANEKLQTICKIKSSFYKSTLNYLVHSLKNDINKKTSHNVPISFSKQLEFPNERIRNNNMPFHQSNELCTTIQKSSSSDQLNINDDVAKLFFKIDKDLFKKLLHLIIKCPNTLLYYKSERFLPRDKLKTKIKLLLTPEIIQELISKIIFKNFDVCVRRKTENQVKTIYNLPSKTNKNRFLNKNRIDLSESRLFPLTSFKSILEKTEKNFTEKRLNEEINCDISKNDLRNNLITNNPSLTIENVYNNSCKLCSKNIQVSKSNKNSDTIIPKKNKLVTLLDRNLELSTNYFYSHVHECYLPNSMKEQYYEEQMYRLQQKEN